MAISSRPGDLSTTILAYRRSTPTRKAVQWTAAVIPRILGRLLSAARAGSMVVAIVTDIVFPIQKSRPHRCRSKAPKGEARGSTNIYKMDRRRGRGEVPVSIFQYTSPARHVTCHSHADKVPLFLFRPGLRRALLNHKSTMAGFDQARSHEARQGAQPNSAHSAHGSHGSFTTICVGPMSLC